MHTLYNKLMLKGVWKVLLFAGRLLFLPFQLIQQIFFYSLPLHLRHLFRPLQPFFAPIIFKLCELRQFLRSQALNFHRRYNVFFYFYLALGTYFAFFFVSSIVPGVRPGIADAAISPSAYHVAVGSLGDVHFKIEATPDGSLAINKDIVNVKTNASVGYRLFLSTNSADPVVGSHLSKNRDSSLGKFILPSSGTTSDPIPLAANTWGFAIPSGASISSSKFDHSYDIANPLITSKWSKVPTALQPELIGLLTTATDTGGQDLEVYYGVNVNTAIDSGRYGATILYTAVIDATDQTSSEATVSPSSTSLIEGGELLTVSTSLKSGLAKISDLVDADDIKAFFWTGNESASSTPENSCKEIAINRAKDNLEFTCKAPARPIGDHRFVISVPKFNFIYTIEAFTYHSPITNFPDNLTYLDEMTPGICSAVTTPAKEHSSDYEVPTKILIDRRDQKTYKIKKLADGNCWMTEDLAFELSNITSLASSSSDVSTNWTPNASTSSVLGIPWNDVLDHNSPRSYKPAGSNDKSTVFYNHYAATAGSLSSGKNSTALHSVCPKGWQLPNGFGYDVDRSFSKLVKSYAVNGKNIDSTSYGTDNPIQFLGSVFNIGFHGEYSHQDGQNSHLGIFGNYWTSTSLGSNQAAFARFSTDNNYSKYSSDNRTGYAIRCVARGIPSPLSEVTTMQQITPSICKKLTIDQNYHLIDARDGMQYSITRARDGNCWMTQNLAFKLSEGTAIDPELSDFPDSNNVFTPSKSTSTVAGESWDQDSNLDGNKKYQYEKNTPRSFMPDSRMAGNSDGKYGIYYNWTAITAGSTDMHTNASNYQYYRSICPRGWRLPSGGDINDTYSFAKLIKAYYPDANSHGTISNVSPSVLESSPLNFVRPGYYSGDFGLLTNNTVNGYFWTASLGTGHNGIAFSFNYDSINSHNEIQRNHGLQVRCVAHHVVPFDGISNMQEMTPEICSKQLIESTARLRDTRDGQFYEIIRAKDGNCWMRTNLNYSLNTNTVLTPNDSDVSRSYRPKANTFDYEAPAQPLPQDRAASMSRRSMLASSGIYYGWEAATAGGSSSSPDGTTVDSSICPKGWKLSRAYGIGSLYVLSLYYPGVTGVGAGPKFTRSGYLDASSGTIVSSGIQGHYWSNMIVDSANHNASRDFFINDFMQTEDSIHNGLSVRCVTIVDKSLSDISYMQEMSAEICKKAAENEYKTLIDARDNSLYNVVRLENRSCWMAEDLKLELTLDQKFNYSDTNLGKHWEPAYSSQTENNNTPWNNGQQSENGRERSFIGGNKVGYYNWYAATAGQGDYNFIPSPSSFKANRNSICPRGWQLPDYYQYSRYSFESLGQHYVDLTNSAPGFDKNGYYNPVSGTLSKVGSDYLLWTDSATSTSPELSAGVYENGIKRDIPRSYGVPLRCVAASSDKITIEDVTHMQAISSEICSNSFINQNAQLIDNRDKKVYKIFKAKDGECWMGQNLSLRLFAGQQISTIDSDFPSGHSFIPQNTTQNQYRSDWGNSCWRDNNANYCLYERSNARSYQVPISDSQNPDGQQGILYNYYAAIGGVSTDLDISSPPGHSICPRGWKLPEKTRSNSAGSIIRLMSSYYPGLNNSPSGKNIDLSAHWLSSPLNFYKSGHVGTNGRIDQHGSSGAYWLNSVSNGINVETLFFSGNSINARRNYPRNQGLAIRCVAR